MNGEDPAYLYSTFLRTCQVLATKSRTSSLSSVKYISQPCWRATRVFPLEGEGEGVYHPTPKTSVASPRGAGGEQPCPRHPRQLWDAMASCWSARSPWWLGQAGTQVRGSCSGGYCTAERRPGLSVTTVQPTSGDASPGCISTRVTGADERARFERRRESYAVEPDGLAVAGSSGSLFFPAFLRLGWRGSRL